MPSDDQQVFEVISGGVLQALCLEVWDEAAVELVAKVALVPVSEEITEEKGLLFDVYGYSNSHHRPEQTQLSRSKPRKAGKMRTPRIPEVNLSFSGIQMKISPEVVEGIHPIETLAVRAQASIAQKPLLVVAE